MFYALKWCLSTCLAPQENEGCDRNAVRDDNRPEKPSRLKEFLYAVLPDPSHGFSQAASRPEEQECQHRGTNVMHVQCS